MQLPLIQRLKLARHTLAAATGLGGARPLSLAEAGGLTVVTVEGRRVFVASPLRWKLYRQGWRARLDRLEREYGVGRHVTFGEGAVVLDVGANVGEFAHVCARHGARVFCFEPDPTAHACLLRNIADCPLAEAHDVVVWNTAGEIAFGLAPERADSSVFVADAPQVTRKATTIARFAREHGLHRIDLVKCDAEGAEPEVLEGIGEAFPIVRAVALDTGPERAGARTHEACAAILAANGMRVIEEKIGTRWMTYGMRD